MKPSIFSITFFAGVILSPLVMAQESSCPKERTWQEAIYAQRTAKIDGQLFTFEAEDFSNASTAVIDGGGDRSGVIWIPMKTGNDTIALTFGKNRPAPAEFGEIGMAVAGPMGVFNWRRMKRPCDMKDGSVFEFSEKDLEIDTHENASDLSTYHGVMKRKGLDFSYSVKFEASGTEPDFSGEGKLRYGVPKPFDFVTDVQGWNLYRANTFVRTIPVGKPVPLSAVLDEISDSSH